MENLKNGFLWGLGFGLSITIIILVIQFFDPNEYEKIQNYTPTKIKGFTITSHLSRVEGTNLVIAGEYKLTETPDFERYKIDAIIRNEQGIFLQQCSSDIDKYNVEIKKSFTKVVVCHNFSDHSSMSSIELSLIGYK